MRAGEIMFRFLLGTLIYFLLFSIVFVIPYLGGCYLYIMSYETQSLPEMTVMLYFAFVLIGVLASIGLSIYTVIQSINKGNENEDSW